MRKERVLAVIMSVLMALSMLPITVFAAETTALNGKLNIQGIAAEGKTLSADFKEVNTEGMTEDDVTYLWSRKTFDDEAAENAGETPELKELGKEKTYTVTQEDIGSKIVLTITGKEENGYSGTLTVTSDEVVDAESGAALEAAAEAQKEDASEETREDQTTDEESTDDQQDNADSTEDIDAAGTETVDEIPPATSDDQQTEGQVTEEQPEQTGEIQEVPTEDTLVKDDQMEDNQLTQADDSAEGEDKAGTETVDGIPPATSDDTYPTEDGNNGTTEDPSNENPSNEEPSNEEPSNKDSSNEEPSGGTQSEQNPDPATANQISVEGETQPQFSFVQDYTADDATAAQKKVTFKNNSDTAVSLSVTASGDENQAATAVWAEQTDAQTNTVTVDPGASATLTITPVTGLGANANPYQQTFTVNNVNDPAAMIATITATVTVQDISHDLTPNPNEPLDFATAKKGYSAVDAKTITYINNGNVPETVIMPVSQSGNYEITTEDSLTLAPNGEGRITFSVRPKAGLAVGSYTETIKVATKSGFEATTPISVAFQVIKDTATITKIQQPAAVSGLPNGTEKSASSLNLPSAVVIETTAGNMKAAVSWNVKGSSYRQSATEEQNFTVSGTITLPDGVDNDNNLNLATSIDVNVKAYSPKIASAENNIITGIDYNGVYTTQSKISFTAVGAGMDNTSPRNGDTRYEPKSWTVLNNTLGWDAAPYTASFGLAKSGDYTLKVNFEQQKYDGNSWQPTNTTDTRQVSFSITKANVTAPGANLTPAISKTGAVKTGDSTQILPFICILIIAAGAIGGVVFYKKKNKNK